MWYSATKTGINEIDLEHGNIDIMLTMIISHKVDEELVGKLIDTLLLHFQSEERIVRKMGKSFPQEHHAEHEKLTTTLRQKKRQWSNGELEASELALEVKQILLNHFSEFDAFLNAE